MICNEKQIENDVCRFIVNSKDKQSLCRKRGEFLCKETLNYHLPLLSHSARELWIKCKRAYYLYKIRGISAKQDKIQSALKFGQMWDKFTENQYKGSDFNDLTMLATQLELTELEIARFNAIARAFEKLCLASSSSDPFTLQKKIIIPGEIVNVIGYVDRAYDDHFVETKMSARPQYYQEPFNISFQVGTYFIANPNWKYVIMEVTRTPTMTWDRTNDSIEVFEEKLYKDILKKAPMYFPGLKRKEYKFGKIFYRSEFPLDRIKETYEIIGQEILNASSYKDDKYFYQSFNCNSPFPCEYIPICKDGVISETLFNFRKKEEEENDTEPIRY